MIQKESLSYVELQIQINKMAIVLKKKQESGKTIKDSKVMDILASLIHLLGVGKLQKELYRI